MKLIFQALFAENELGYLGNIVQRFSAPSTRTSSLILGLVFLLLGALGEELIKVASRFGACSAGHAFWPFDGWSGLVRLIVVLR
jgi:hypothetical protein